MRPRISQMLVLPQFQKQGLGARLLDTVCKYYWNNPKVVDITGMLQESFVHANRFSFLFCFSNPYFNGRNVKLLIKYILVEDPSDDFIRLRDFVDVQNSLKLLECFSSTDKVRSGFNDGMVKEANEKLKLCKRQTRRVYEIVRLHWTKKAGPLNDDSVEYKAYRVDVKKRLNIPFQVTQITNFAR